MRFNIYIFPVCTHVTLTSLTIFGGKKMQSGRQERCFSSNYSTPKRNGKIRVKKIYLDHINLF